MADDPAARALARRLSGALAAPPRRGRALLDGSPQAPVPAFAPAARDHAGGAFVFTSEDEAGAGPLAGRTLAVKDLIAVGGLPVGAGSRVRADAPDEPRDAPVVAALRAAGARLVGTTTLHELAIGVTGINAWAGTPRNPLDPARVPGGSSSGSAVAVALGAADIALGTDTGGSVRIPAALCGVVGLKPSHGALTTDGVHPLAPTLDHVGLLARTVRDVAAAAAVLGIPTAGHAPDRPRVAYVAAELEAADPAIATAVTAALRALERAGATLVAAELPDAEHVFATSTTILLAEAAAVHAADLAEVPERFGADVAARFAAGLALDAPTLTRGYAARHALRAQLGRTLDGLDAIAGPTVPIPAPRIADLATPGDAAAAGARLVAGTRLANVCGLPAVSLPTTTPGIGLQLLGAGDAALLALAVATERALRRAR